MNHAGPLCYLSATEALEGFRAGTLSPVELMRALIERSLAVQPTVNAFTHTFFERAMTQAREAEVRYRRGEARALEGLALAVKDLHPVCGEITTHGSKIFEHNRDETTLRMVQRMLDAGAILLARTTTPEFGSATVTHSRLWGVTRNPWNLSMSPGGSSGGAGAALAAGMTTLADGSDFGGSIRIPASCCGVVGYKPPHGRNPSDPGAALDPFTHFGPLARSVADAALQQNVISGWSEDDLAAIPERIVLPLTYDGDLRGVRVAVSMDLGFIEVDPEVQANTRAAVEALRALGCLIEDVALPWTARVLGAFDRYHAASDAATLWPLLPTRRDELTDYALHEIERGAQIPARALFEVHQMRGEMYGALGPVLARCDVLVCPTTALPAVEAEHSPVGSLRVNGRAVHPNFGWVLTYPFNMLGALPVMSIPSGRAANGVPTGVQIVARPHDDLRVFRVAAALERALGAQWYREESTRPVL